MFLNSCTRTGGAGHRGSARSDERTGHLPQNAGRAVPNFCMSESEESIVIEDRLRSYIFKQYPALQTQGLANDQPLTGVLDSLAVLGVVGFIEPEFLVELSPSDLIDENFETLGSIARLVERLKATVK